MAKKLSRGFRSCFIAKLEISAKHIEKIVRPFPIRFDRYRYYAVLLIAFAIIPFLLNDYWVNAIFLPFLIYSIAAIGLNILTGYCGQVSLGTGGFMAVGAYATYKLMTSFPEVSMVVHILLAGGITALVGVLFGLPSLLSLIHI